MTLDLWWLVALNLCSTVARASVGFWRQAGERLDKDMPGVCHGVHFVHVEIRDDNAEDYEKLRNVSMTGPRTLRVLYTEDLRSSPQTRGNAQTAALRKQADKKNDASDVAAEAAAPTASAPPPGPPSAAKTAPPPQPTSPSSQRIADLNAWFRDSVFMNEDKQKALQDTLERQGDTGKRLFGRLTNAELYSAAAGRMWNRAETQAGTAADWISSTVEDWLRGNKGR